MVSRFFGRRACSLIGITLAAAFACVIKPPLVLAQGSLGTFSSTLGMTQPRASFWAVQLPEGRVFLYGGNASGNDAEIYDPSTGRFASAGSPPAGATSSAAPLPDGRVLLAGGPPNEHAAIFDPATNSYSQTSGVLADPSGRTPAVALLMPNGQVLLAEGVDQSGKPLAGEEVFDPATGQFSEPEANFASHTCKGSGSKGVVLPSGRILITGGDSSFDGSGAVALNCAELFDPITQSWSITGPMVTQRSFASATVLNSGKVLVAGGRADASGFVVHASAELYDPRTGSFASIGNMTNARGEHAASVLPNGQVLMSGGTNTDSAGIFNALSSAELFNPASNSFAVAGSMSVGRFNHVSLPLFDNSANDDTAFVVGLTMVAGGNGAGGGNPALRNVDVYQPPGNVNLGAPINHSTVSGSVEIGALRSSSVWWIDFYIDGKFFKASPPFAVTWDSTTVPNGQHTISATAFASSGANVGSSSVTVNVANGPMALTWPQPTTTVSGPTVVAIRRTSQVQWVNFYVDGAIVQSTPPFAFDWNSASVANGVHTLSARAFNSSHTQVGIDSFKVTVSN